MDKLDPDFAPASDHEEDTFLIETTPIDDNIYLVYGSCLKKLLRYCSKCGEALDTSLTKIKKNTGSQLSMSLACLSMCYFLLIL